MSGMGSRCGSSIFTIVRRGRAIFYNHLSTSLKAGSAVRPTAFGVARARGKARRRGSLVCLVVVAAEYHLETSVARSRLYRNRSSIREPLADSHQGRRILIAI
jgi:hypothetical protein